MIGPSPELFEELQKRVSEMEDPTEILDIWLEIELLMIQIRKNHFLVIKEGELK